MARIRSIKPETFTSEALSRCSVEARWTFAGLWTYVDDQGRGKAEPRLVKAAVWPLDDEITPKHVAQYLDELEGQSLICRYDPGLLHVVNFQEHQHPQHPSASKLPECSATQHPPGGGQPFNGHPHGSSGEPHEDDRKAHEDSSLKGVELSGVELSGGTRAKLRETQAATSRGSALLNEHLDNLAEERQPALPRKVVGALGREIDQLVEEGFDDHRIRGGLRLLASNRRFAGSPNMLPRFVAEAQSKAQSNTRAPRGQLWG